MDPTDRQILTALQENPRISHTELARKLRMSRGRLSDRIRQLEQSGIVQGYRAVIDRTRIGFPVQAFLQIQAPAETYAQVIALARDIPEVRECHHTDGEESFHIRVSAASPEDLAAIASQFREIGPTRTSPIVSTPVEKHMT
jgi:Lrp/AsnC family transcriptional regulator, leucine-responsive regulatory protein